MLNLNVQATTAAEAAASMISGHNIYIGRSSDDSTFWKYELLRNAKKSIEISCGYANGRVFLQVYNILKEQLEKKPEIQIHFMVSQNTGSFTEENIKRVKELGKTYPQNFHYIITNFKGQIVGDKAFYTMENHMKLIIVDEKYFLLGGTNLMDNMSRNDIPEDCESETLQEAFLSKAASDQDVVVSGPMAKKLREEFYQVFDFYSSDTSLCTQDNESHAEKTAYFPIFQQDETVIDSFDNHPKLVRDVKAYGVISGPQFNYHLIGDLYEYFIKRAQESVVLAHLYFFPEDKIFFSLIEAANRNLDIDLITNGLNIKEVNSFSAIMLYAYMNRTNYLPIILGKTFQFWQKKDAYTLAPKRTSIYEYNRDFVLYHKKVMIIDNKFSTVGSYNLGKKSENSDFEVNIFIDSHEVAIQLQEVIEEDMCNSTVITLNNAIDYYFDIFYSLITELESIFFDGIILNINKFPTDENSYW